MLKKELHEFLIENEMEYKTDAETYFGAPFPHLYHHDKIDIYYSSMSDNAVAYARDNKGIGIDPLMRTCVKDLTLDILKETLINAGIEVKDRSVGISDEPQLKVGDKVRFTKSNDNQHFYSHIDLRNKIGVVAEIDGKNIIVKFSTMYEDGGYFKFVNNELELIKESKQMKAEFHVETPTSTSCDHEWKSTTLGGQEIGQQCLKCNLYSTGYSASPEHWDFLQKREKEMQEAKSNINKVVDKYQKENIMETKTAKWQIDDGNVIEVEIDEQGKLSDLSNKILDKLTNLYDTFCNHRPWQYNGKESGFTILLEDGTVKYAKYIKPEYEFKVGDVVKYEDKFFKICCICQDYLGVPICYDYDNDDRSYALADLALITSFEEWCKDNLPPVLRVDNDGKEWDLFDDKDNIYACIPKSWTLIDQIKVAQAIIEAVKNSKDNE